MKSKLSPLRSIKQRMIVLFFGLSILSVCLTAGFSHYFYSKAVKEEFVMVAEEATGRLNHHLEFYFRQMKNSTNTLLNTDLVQKWLSENYTPDVEDIAGIEKEMNTYVSFNFREINNMFLVSNDRRVLPLNNSYIPEDREMMDAWFADIKAVTILPTHRLGDNGPLVMDMIIPIHSTQTTTMIGKLVLQFSLTEIDAAFNKSRLGKSGYFFLLSKEDIVVNHPEKEWVGKAWRDTPLSGLNLDMENGTSSQKWNGEAYLVSVYESKNTGWNIVSVVPYAEMAKGLNSAVFSTMIALAILALSIFLIIPFLVSQFVAPIKYIKTRMERVAKGNLGIRAAPKSGIHEYQVLTNSFNYMVEQLNELMQVISEYRVKEVQLQLRQSVATVRALQNQINPHLLYNTLDIIKSIAYLEEVPMIEKIAYNLADVYRYASKGSDQEVTIREELSILIKYLDIVHIRYPKKFESNVRVNEKFMNCPIIKLTVQPIVENAVKYAVEVRGGNAAIVVNAYEEGRNLIIEIADNGPGIPEERLAELRNQFHGSPSSEVTFRGESIGLANVHARIRLKYGEPYGISVHSFPGRGSVVSIRIPYGNETYNPVARTE
ncbi:histidine kinase [Paenibacillus peoriae]|uniref:cache domain-containing sensor histidine kinase n=1 Tax=Paenibacillus peoriae TaxID=59893 RepID=UPI00026C6696|nr:sensor histidine kinase [Paenibacillus peoriae]MEC0184187.1 histidine kinase [Paenibacillus peoriae]